MRTGTPRGELARRTRAFARTVIAVSRILPTTREGRLLGDQLFRSGTSVGSNYRAACRARSRAEFIAKLGIALEEADESQYWLELIADMKLLSVSQVSGAAAEAGEVVAMLVASIKTAKGI